MTPEVLYEDNHLLVVNKPAGLLTQPSGTDQDSLESLCKAYLKAKYQKPGQVFLHAIHRLDKPVSGIVVFARTSKALSRLQESMKGKHFKKVYEALVENIPKPLEGSLEHYLIHDEHRAIVAEASNSEAKHARLHYRVKEKRGSQALVEVELETGRYHQIRVQLAAIGCPVVGDTKYGSKHSLPDKTIALHHSLMEIPHPTTGETLVIKSFNPM